MSNAKNVVLLRQFRVVSPLRDKRHDDVVDLPIGLRALRPYPQRAEVT